MSVKDLKREEIKEKAIKAINDGNTKEQTEVIEDWMQSVALEVAERVSKEQSRLQNDTIILTNRGEKQLTSAEINYFEKLATAMKANNIRQALTDIDVVMPITTINRVFDELVEAHP